MRSIRYDLHAVSVSMPNEVSLKSNVLATSGDWDAIWIRPSPEETAPPLGESLASGDVVVCVPNMVTPAEIQTLVDAGTREACAEQEKILRRGLPISVLKGKTQLPCTGLSDEVAALCEVILRRAMKFVDSSLPSVGRACVSQKETLTTLYNNGELAFAHREPAINVYSAKGEFAPHRDGQDLTILFPLSIAGVDYVGGGTGFWEGSCGTKPNLPPQVVLKPEPGTAMLFAGHVTHAGMPVIEGLRVVFVSSFSNSRKNA